MGKNNRRRRAAKAAKAKKATRARETEDARNARGRKRTDGTAGAERSNGGAGAGFNREQIESLVDYLLATGTATTTGVDRRKAEILQVLADCSKPLVGRVLEARLAALLDWLWASGWLPGEVIRQVRRAGSSANAAVVAAAIAADHGRRDPASLHPAWIAHVEDLELSPVPDSDWLASSALLRATGCSWPEQLAAAVETVVLADLGRSVCSTIPPPGSRAVSSPLRSEAANDPVLDKIRHLLAQAESTNYDAEAEAFTAKAHELMARHALDAAAVWSRSRNGEDPITVRVAVDEPYVDAKSLLLQVVAESFRCRAVYHSHFAFSTLVGFDCDLISAQTLYTSLLVQAQQALSRATKAAPPGAHTRSRRYRSSFLRSFAGRIGERLAEINDRVQSDPDIDCPSLLPVLARRNSAVEEAMAELFPDVVSSAVRGGYDWRGHSDGRSAAEQADLNRPVGNRDRPVRALWSGAKV